MFGTGKRLATAIALTATLVTAGSATASRPATAAETNQIFDSAVRVYSNEAIPAYCRQDARAVVSTADPGWARLTFDERTPTSEQILAGEGASCGSATILALRLPGYRSYQMVWDSSINGPKPCWAMGTAVTRDLIPAGACQTGARRKITLWRGDPVPGPRVGLRSPTTAEAAGIVRAIFGTRKRCYASINVKVARGNKGWARVHSKFINWQRYPLSCGANGSAFLVKVPGSGKWVHAWSNSGDQQTAPCWLAGGNTARALVESWKWRCEPPYDEWFDLSPR